ncbi:MAG TPA: Rid family detoxifying hydrolase [Atopostipes sp.]|jgi:endoribonuclease L-PSP, putative|nr:Rid family detoxifying hydrolase [Atopostipes sp.]
MEKIESSRATGALGPYSHGIISGELVFISGQLGIDPETGKLADGIENQVRYAFKNILYILEEKNLNFNHIVKTTILLSDISDFQTVNEIYAEQFSEPFPARSAYAVAGLPLNSLVEIEVIAELNQD